MTTIPKGYKSASNSIMDVDLGKRTALTAYATYGTLDRDKDRAHKGMFTKSWQEFKDVRIFLNHDKTQAPGKLYDGNTTTSLWEDDKHAYAKMWMGTHTLGSDVLKMMDEKVITDSSYYMVPIKYDKNESGGYNYREVFQKEVSVLTHWGAHPESKILAVQKSADIYKYSGDFSVGDVVTPLPGMEHMTEQAGMKMIVVERNGYGSYTFYAVKLPDGSVHKWYRSDEIMPAGENAISTLLSAEAAMNMKKELSSRLNTLKSFCQNTTASDDAIQKVLKEAESIEQLLMMDDTLLPGQVKEQSESSSNRLGLELLNIKMLLS